jgi:PIN domain nuclease of toxin-antitoxin system
VKYVLDASAMIALLRDEPGAQMVEDIATDRRNSIHAHAMNLVEVFYDFHRAAGVGAAQDAMDDLVRAGVVEDCLLDRDLWQDVGGMKAALRRVSLADCFGICLAKRLGAVFLTADHHELDRVKKLGLYEIEFIR